MGVSYKWTESGGSNGSFIGRSFRAIQTRPIDYTMPLAYYNYHARFINAWESWYNQPSTPLRMWNQASSWGDKDWAQNARNYDQVSWAGLQDSLPNGAEWKRAYAKAYGKFVGFITDRCQMMTNVAERGETVKMLLNRLSQFRDAAVALRKKDFRKFLAVWGVKPLPKHRNKVWVRPREVSGLWLEYWFGWAPTINDIYTAVETYGAPVKPDTIKFGSAVNWARTSSYSVNSENRLETAEKGKVQVSICGRIVVENPSLFEANRLGLVNPAATALELIPFSWLAGWFVNLQQVLNQYTDFVGLKLIDGSVSTKTTSWYSYERDTQFGTYRIHWEQRVRAYTRRPVRNLPRVRIVASLPKGLSITRGATLASLVVQLLAPVKR